MLLFAMALAAICVPFAVTSRRQEIRRMAAHQTPEVLLPNSKHSYEIYDPASLPKNWDWRSVGGVNYCTRDLNQYAFVFIYIATNTIETPLPVDPCIF